MEQPGKIRAGANPDTWPRLLNGTRSADSFSGFEYQNAFASESQVRRASESVVTGPNDNHIPSRGS
jgi:hypothetical protein